MKFNELLPIFIEDLPEMLGAAVAIAGGVILAFGLDFGALLLFAGLVVTFIAANLSK